MTKHSHIWRETFISNMDFVLFLTQLFERRDPRLENLPSLVAKFGTHEAVDENVDGGIDDWKYRKKYV